jgi:hypothetical protein
VGIAVLLGIALLANNTLQNLLEPVAFGRTQGCTRWSSCW